MGNRLCLDFANLPWQPGDATEYTVSWPELVEFLSAKKIVSSDRAEQLRTLPENDHYAAETLLRQAEQLGREMRRIFRAVVRGQRIHRDWTEPINQILRVTEGYDQLEWDGATWRLAFVAREEGPEWLLAAVARSAAELIAEGHTRNLRQCASPNCQILFYDESRTRRRRWCTMSLCGNRSKVAAFARRQSGEKARAQQA